MLLLLLLLHLPLPWRTCCRRLNRGNNESSARLVNTLLSRQTSRSSEREKLPAMWSWLDSPPFAFSTHNLFEHTVMNVCWPRAPCAGCLGPALEMNTVAALGAAGWLLTGNPSLESIPTDVQQ